MPEIPYPNRCSTAILAIRKNLNMALFEQREIHLDVLCDEAINNVH